MSQPEYRPPNFTSERVRERAADSHTRTRQRRREAAANAATDERSKDRGALGNAMRRASNALPTLPWSKGHAETSEDKAAAILQKHMRGLAARRGLESGAARWGFAAPSSSPAGAPSPSPSGARSPLRGGSNSNTRLVNEIQDRIDGSGGNDMDDVPTARG